MTSNLFASARQPQPATFAGAGKALPKTTKKVDKTA